MIHFSITSFFISVLLLLFAGCGNAPYKKFRKKSGLHSFARENVQKDLKKNNLKKSINDMSLEELRTAKSAYEKIDRSDRIVKINERIVALSQDIEEKAQLILESADLELGHANFTAAQKLYETFVTLYPGSACIKQARCHQILAHLWNADAVDRDMAEVIMATQLARTYLKDYPDDTEYSDEVHEALNECFIMRFEHELGIVRFYLIKYHRTYLGTSLKAAYQRLYAAQEDYLDLLSLYNKSLEPFIEKITNMHACSDLLFKSDEELDNGTERPSTDSCAQVLASVVDELTVVLHPRKPTNPRDKF